MAHSLKVDPIEKWTTVSVKSDLSIPEQKASIAKFVQAAIDTAVQLDERIIGRKPSYSVTVDGRLGAPLDSVNPDGGTIIAEFELVSDVLAWIAETLRDRSPVLSGRYKSSHIMFADGTEADPNAAPSASQYVFINDLPYVRKIEVGKTKSGRDFVISVENRIYERTATDAKARFGNLTNIRFTYQPLLGGEIGRWANSSTARALANRNKRRAKSIAWLTSQPAIIVSLLSK